MREVVLDGEGGRTRKLRRVKEPDADRIWTYIATLSVVEGQVTTEVWDMGKGLGPFMREIAEAWRGFDGVKGYSSLEGQRLSCRHDGLGTVLCEVVLAKPEPPEWRFGAVLRLGAGAHVDRLAGDLEAFCGSAS